MSMKRTWFLLVLAACEKKADVPPPPPPPPIPVQLVRCVAAPVPLGISHGGDVGGGIGISGGGDVYTPAATLKKVRIEVQGTHAIGAFDPAIVSRYIKRSGDDIAHCYDTLVTGKTAGTIDVGLTVGGDGKVTDATAKGMADNLDDCVVQVMRGLALPAPKDGGRTKATTHLIFSYIPATGFSAGGRPIAFRDHERKVMSTIANTPETRAMIDRTLAGLTAPTADLPEQWTPFARHVPNEDAPDVDSAVAAAIKTKLGELEHCFGDAKGSTRALIALGATAADTRVRVGGFGDAKVEACVAGAVRGLAFAPAAKPHEVACDLVHGEAAPWHLSPAGYTIVHATKTGAAVDGGTVAKDHIALIATDRDAPGSAIAAAITAAAAAPISLVTVGGELAGVSPAHDWMSRRPIVLSASGGKLHACLGGITLDGSPALTDRAAITAAIAGAEKEWCHPACGVELALGELAASDLVTIAAAARGAGIDPIGIDVGSDETPCAP